MTDAFTKYVELVALTDKEAETTGEAIFNKWICRYGTPLEIVSDNGKEFRNKLAEELYKRLNIDHTTTAAYHPQCNAQAEVCNKTIAKYLNSFVDETTLDWEQYLAPMAFSYNTSLHRSIKTTPYFLTYGEDARLPSFPSPDIQRCYSETAAGDWYNRLHTARDLATRNNMKATIRAESDHNKKAQEHEYKVGQQIWLDERNFLSKNRKLAANWSGPFFITKVRDNGNIRIKLNRKEINVNVNRIKPYIASVPEPKPEPEISKPEVQISPPVVQKEEEQPWIEVKRKQNPKPAQNQAPASEQKRGRGRPRKNLGPPKDTTIQFPPRWTRARAQQMRQEQEAAQTSAQDLLIEELIKTHNIAALIKTEQQKWDACLIKTGPSSFVMDEYALPKQIQGVQQPNWVYKRRNFLKSLSVEERNSILTGDPAFAFDPVPYQVVYNYSYADAVRQVPALRAPAPAPAPQPVPAQLPPAPRALPPAILIAPPPAPLPVVPQPAQVQAATPQPKPDLAQPKLEPVKPPKEPTPGPSKPNPFLNRPTFASLSKIREQGFGAEDLAQATAFKQDLEERERQAEIAAKQIQESVRFRENLRDRLSSTSSDSSNYDTPPGSPNAPTTKTKGKLKKNLDQVTNALGFSFASSRVTRASIRKKEGTGWPPKS
jgi:hypothetical protein